MKQRFYNNGSVVTTAKNRRVTVVKEKDNDGDYILVETKRADLSKESLEDNTCLLQSKVFKNKMKVSQIVFTIEGAYGLMLGLQDYFNRIHTDTKSEIPVAVENISQMGDQC